MESAWSRAFLLLGHPYHTAAAFADFLQQLVATNYVPRSLLGQRDHLTGRTREQAAVAFVGGNQSRDPREQYGIGSARIGEKTNPLFRRLRKRVGEQGFIPRGNFVHGQQEAIARTLG